MINRPKKPCSHGRVTRVLESGGFLVTEARYPPGFRIPRHEHDLPGFTYVAAGSSVEALRARSLECVRGSVVVKPPDTPHTNVYGEAGAVCLLVEFRPWRYDSIRQHTEVFERVSVGRGGPSAAIAGRLLREVRRPADELSPLMIEALVLEIAGEASRAGRDPRGAPRWLGEVRSFLHEEFRSIRRVSEVAQVAGVHPVHLARVFRARVGCSIGTYLRRLRLESAAMELTRTDRPIAAIALESGFADQSHLTHAFKAFFGTSPGRYRRQGESSGPAAARPRRDAPDVGWRQPR